MNEILQDQPQDLNLSPRPKMRTPFTLLILNLALLVGVFVIESLSSFSNHALISSAAGTAAFLVGILLCSGFFSLISRIHHRDYCFLEIFNFSASISLASYAVIKVLSPLDLLFAQSNLTEKIYLPIFAIITAIYWIGLLLIVLRGSIRAWPICIGGLLTILFVGGGFSLYRLGRNATDNYKSHLPTGLPFSVFARDLTYDDIFGQIRSEMASARSEVDSHLVQNHDDPLDDLSISPNRITLLRKSDDSLWDHPDYWLYAPASIRGDQKPTPNSNLLIVFRGSQAGEETLKNWKPVAEATQRWLLVSKEVTDGPDVREPFQRLKRDLFELHSSELGVGLERTIAAGFGGGGMASHMFVYYHPGLIQGVLVNAGYMNEKLYNTVYGSLERPYFAAMVVSKADTTKYSQMTNDRKLLDSLDWKTLWYEYEGGHILAPVETLVTAMKALDEGFSSKSTVAEQHLSDLNVKDAVTER